MNEQKENQEETREESEVETEESEVEAKEELELPPSPSDPRENIRQKFLVEMPEDFYLFWKFCCTLNEKSPPSKL